MLRARVNGERQPREGPVGHQHAEPERGGTVKVEAEKKRLERQRESQEDVVPEKSRCEIEGEGSGTKWYCGKSHEMQTEKCPMRLATRGHW